MCHPIQLRSHYIFLVYVNASHTAAPKDLSRVCECMRVLLPKDHKCIHLMVFHWTLFRSLYSLHLFSWRLISLPDVALNVQFVHVSPQVYMYMFLSVSTALFILLAGARCWGVMFWSCNCDWRENLYILTRQWCRSLPVQGLVCQYHRQCNHIDADAFSFFHHARSDTR